MSNKSNKPVHWLITRFFLGFIFSVLLALSIMLYTIIVFAIVMAVFAGSAAAGSYPNIGSFLVTLGYFVKFFWQLIGDCVEDKPIGTNMKQKKDEIGWFFRVLSEQANNKQSLSIKITKYVLGILISCACLAGSGFAGYLFFNTLISGTLALSLGLILSLGATVGLGFGILLMIAEIYKIVKSVQKHYIDQYLEQFDPNTAQYNKAKKEFDIILTNDETLRGFINQKTSKEENRQELTKLFNGTHENKELDESAKIKIFALMYQYNVDKAKAQINKIINQYPKQK